LINRTCKAYEGISKVLVVFFIANVVFDLPEGLIDLLEALDEGGVNVDLKFVECALKGLQLFLDIP